jgi:hypothetical protein
MARTVSNAQLSGLLDQRARDFDAPYDDGEDFYVASREDSVTLAAICFGAMAVMGALGLLAWALGVPLA